MQSVLPKSSSVFAALLRADYTTQWRNRRSVILSILVPIVILISWKGIIGKVISPEFALSSVITVGLMAVGLMGYSNSVARDRDKGIFQRLRVAPIVAGSIMMSRLTVQLTMIMVITAGVFLVGYFVDNISIAALGYVLGFAAAMVGGAVYLGLGQAIVGLITNPDTVNSTTRLVYFIFIMVGMSGEFGAFHEIKSIGPQIEYAIHWSPYGAVRNLLSQGLAGNVTVDLLNVFLVNIGYAVVFSFAGIRKFKWTTR